jgi:hypothetical protein
VAPCQRLTDAKPIITDILRCPLSVAVLKLLQHGMAKEAAAKGSVSKKCNYLTILKRMPVSIATIKPHFFPGFHFSQFLSRFPFFTAHFKAFRYV